MESLIKEIEDIAANNVDGEEDKEVSSSPKVNVSTPVKVSTPEQTLNSTEAQSTLIKDSSPSNTHTAKKVQNK